MRPSSRTSSSLSILAACLVSLLSSLSACGGAASLGPADGEKVRRRPDGVAIDPISAPPPPRDRATVGEGLVTLRTPLGVDRALATVEELFRKIVQEDAEGLEALFAPQAVSVTNAPPGGSPGSANALPFWQGRFRRLDYTKLAGEPLYREAEIQIFRPDDTAEALPHGSVRPDTLGENDVVLRVPVLTTRIGAERLFGDELLLFLRRDGDRYRIYRILEDFTLN
jgi:hypothetical protein